MNLHDHLLSRGLDPSEYHVVLDEENNTATFLLFALGTGKLAGYQQYRPDRSKERTEDPRDMRYFTFVTKSEGSLVDTVAVFGTEKFNWANRTVYLTEGVFDAVKLHSLGLNALAVLANNPKPLRGFLKALGMKVVGVLDNDKAGQALGKFCDESFVCTEKDAGEMTTDELKRLLGV